jgi:leucyl-tRNA synthetase
MLSMSGLIRLKIMQKNWIGKSFGCEIKFEIESEKEY